MQEHSRQSGTREEGFFELACLSHSRLRTDCIRHYFNDKKFPRTQFVPRKSFTSKIFAKSKQAMDVQDESVAAEQMDVQSSVAATGSQEDVELTFLAKISNAKIIYNILNGIHLKKDQVWLKFLPPTF